EYQTTTLSELNSIPLSASTPGMANAEILGNVANVTRTRIQLIYSHYNFIPVVDVYAGVSGRDLGGVLSDVKPIVEQPKKTAPPGASIVGRGTAGPRT